MGKHTSEILVHLDLVTLCILTGSLSATGVALLP